MEAFGRRLCALLLLLSGWTLHGGNCWRTKQEYVYQLQGRTVTSFLTLDADGVGVHYLATLRVQAASDSVLLFRVEDAKYSRIQEKTEDSWWRLSDETDGQWQQLPLSDNTVVVTHSDGVVKNVAHSPDLREWEVNFMQGVAGLLQADLGAGGDALSLELSNSHGKKKRASDTSVYKVMENGVAGRCEVLYEVSKVSKAQAKLGSDWPDNTDVCEGRSLLEITKSTNYSNCERSAEYHVGLPASAAGCNAGSNLCGDFWQRVFVTRMRGCGDQKDLTVLDSVGTSRQLANIHLHEDSGAAINSYFNLSIVSAQPVEKFLPTVSNPSVQKNLAYYYVPQELEEGRTRAARSVPMSHSRRVKSRHHEVQRPRSPVQPDASSSEEDRSSEAAGLPLPDGNNPQQLQYCPQFLARKTPDVSRPQLVEDFRRVLLEVAADMDEPSQLQGKMGLEKLENVVVACRSLTWSELQLAIGGIIDNQEIHSDTQRKLVMDTLAMCGTHPSFRVIKESIESEKISAISAADVVASLSDHMSAPTETLLDEFASLMNSPAVKKDQQLLISTTLAFSNLVRTACVSVKAKKAYYTPETFKADVCSSRSAEKYLRQLLTVAKQSPGLQAIMLTALGNTGLPSALPLLASVAQGDTSGYARAMAVFSMRHHALMQPAATTPVLLGLYQRQENPVAVRMAAVALLWHTNPQFTVWQRVAVSTWYEKDPALVAFISSSLDSFAHTENPTWKQMKTYAQAALKLTKPVPIGLERAYNVLWSATSEKLNNIVMQQLEWIYNFKFSSLYYHSFSRLGEFSWHNLEVELDAANPSAFLSSVKDLVSPPEDPALSRPPLKDIPRSTWDLGKTLSMALKNVPSMDGSLRLKAGHLMERMWPLSKKLQLELVKAGRGMMSELKQGRQFHLQKVDMKMFMIETTNEMGFPVSLKLSVPQATRLSGQAKMAEDGNHIAVDVSAFHARHLVGELMVYTAWDKMVHVAGSQGCAMVASPSLRFNARLDLPANLVQLEMKPNPQSPVSGLVHHSSRPYVIQKNIWEISPSAEQKVIRLDRPRKQLEYRGSKLTFSYESDDARGMYDLFDDSISVLGFPMWPNLHASFINIRLGELPPVVSTFGLGVATVKDGDLFILKAPGEGQPWPVDALERGIDVSMMGDMGETSGEPQWEMPSFWQSTPATPHSHEDLAEPWRGSDPGESSEECADEEDEHVLSLEQDLTFARGLEPHEPSVNGSVYLLHESLKDFKYGSAYVISANISVNLPNPHVYSAYWLSAMRPLGLERRMALFVKEMTSDWQLSLGYEDRDPLWPIFGLNEEILANLNSTIVSDIELRVNGTKFSASLLGGARLSEGTPSDVLKVWREEGCQAENSEQEPVFNKKCWKIMDRATSFDSFRAALTFSEEVKDIIPVDNSVQDMMESGMEQYLHEEKETGQRSRKVGKVLVTAHLASNWRTVNLMVTTPGRVMYYKDIPTGFGPTDQVYMERPYTSGVFRPASCIIGKNRIATYDDVEYQYGINSCWHVATMDCSGKNKVAVLARIKDYQMELELNADNYKIISVLPGPRVLVNHEQLDLGERNVTQIEDNKRAVFAEVSLSPDNTATIDLLTYGIRVLYQDSAAIIESSPYLDGRMCGLCGDQDGEQADEFTGPAGGVLSSASDFGRSFLIRDSDCKPDSSMESPGLC